MSAQHTRGPWAVNQDNEYCGARIDGGNGRAVAHAIQRDNHPTLGGGITQDEAQANARLIAAAPDLLDALRYLVMHCKSFDHLPAHPIANAIGEARVAIARATGSAA